MKSAELLDAFETLAEAPSGISRLRELVRTLAIAGKLVPQDPEDEPADAAISRAKETQIGLFEKGEIARPRPTKPMEDRPCPVGWAWARLGDLVAILDFRRRPVKKADRLNRIRGKNPDELYPYYGATQQAGWIDDYLFDEELLLLGEDGAPFFREGKHVAYVASGRFWVNNHAHVIRGMAVTNRYLCHVLNQVSYEGYVSGTTRLKLTQARMVDIPVPVPPLAEQHRIVAKVDELVVLIDRLETAHHSRDTTRQSLREATLSGLCSTGGDDSVREHWRRFADQAADLMAGPDDVLAVRQAVLQLAVRGRLTAGNAEDDPAFEILEQIAHEKADLVRSKAIPPPRRLPPVATECVVDPIPPGWARSFLANCFSFDLTDGDWVESKDQDPAGSIRLTQLADIGVGAFKNVSRRYLNESTAERLRCTRLVKGDLLIARLPRPLGRACVFPGLEQPCVTVVDVAIGRPGKACLDMHYLTYLLNSPPFTRRVEQVAVGTTRKRVSTGNLRKIVIPIPPMAEQRRIVAKVDELMALCDGLEARLERARAAQEAFAASAVASVA